MLPTLGLLLVSLIWGTTFVAVKAALDEVPPLLFLGLRFGVAAAFGLLLLRRPVRGAIDPAVPVAAGLAERSASGPAEGGSSDGSSGGGRGRGSVPTRRQALLWGVPLGLVLGVAFAAQTIGLTTTTPARSGFLTGLNVLLIPVWGAWILRSRPGRLPLVGLAVALVGLWLLTDPGTGSWVVGDTWTVLCAVLFGLHVVLLTRFGASHDVPALLVSQLLVTSVLGLVGSWVWETPRFTWSREVVGALALTGILASFVTTWLQLRLQPRVSPARTAVLFALEPVFAALFSIALWGERLGPQGWFGGGLIVAGALLSESSLLRRGRA